MVITAHIVTNEGSLRAYAALHNVSKGLTISLSREGKGDVGGLAAAPRQHHFFHKGRKYRWDGKLPLEGRGNSNTR